MEFLRKLDIVYINKFIDMYNMMTPNKLEEIFLEIESDIGIRLPDNFKNILFLSYSRHYEKINKVLVDGRVFNSLKK